LINSFSTASRGVAILIKRGVDCTVEDQYKDEGGNLLSVKLTIAGLEFLLVTLYGPNKDDPEFYVNLESLISQNSEYPVVVCGDWNLVLNQANDTRAYIRENNLKAREKVSQMMESLDLLDIWRIKHPERREYTWQSSKHHTQRGRLDFYLISKDVAALVKKCSIKEGYKSDHKLVCLELDKLEWKRGKGFWKLNVDLLSDKNYVDIIKKTIKDTVEKYTLDRGERMIDNQMLWEMIKLEVRGRSISFSSFRQKVARQKEKEIESEVIELGEQIRKEECEERQLELQKRLELEKAKLEESRQPRIRAMIKRAKAQYYEEGEKPSKFFINLEKKNFLNKLITRLVDGDKVAEKPLDILSVQREFYKNLYTSRIKEDEIESTFFLQEANIKKLSSSQKDSCEGLVTENEISKVIKGMKNGKTPGSDGFPVEFFKVFWLDIKNYLLDSLNSAIEKGEMSLTQKQGIITCIPKAGNRELMKNWRPITLLNVDYKILSGVLSQRLRKVLQEIVSEEQKGFLAGRYIGENTRLVYDMMHYLQEKDKKGLIMLVDFEKAFDSLEWSYIERVLSAYGFGEGFIKGYKVLYNDSQSCVINGGHFSTFFNLERGCRQGDPISAYIFILSVEPLAMAIKNSQIIKGIQVKGKEFKIGQYADDTFMLLDGSDESLTESLNLLDRFHTCTGLKINVDKTQVAWIGCCRNSPKKLCPHVKLKWVTSFKLLGIHFNVDISNMLESNYNIKLGEIEQLLSVYQKRYLSLLGKVTVIKTLAIPKLIHILSVLPSPGRRYIEQLEAIFRKFIWNNKRARVSFDQLCKPIGEGGLKMTSIKTLIEATRMSWIKRLLIGNGSWQDLFENAISDDRQLIWELDTESLREFGNNISNSFWREVFQSWAKYRTRKIPKHEFEYLHFPIWNSDFMKTAGIIRQKKVLQAHGLNYVRDLFDEGGNKLGYEDFTLKYSTRINFVDFYSMMHSLKQDWRPHNVNDASVDNKTSGLIKKITKCSKVCKLVYSELIQNTQQNDNCIDKWCSYGVCNENEDWKSIYCIPFKVTTENKLRSFQYQILRRSLVTNKFLYMCKIIESGNCSFCNNYEETIEHLFYECHYVLRFWLDIMRILPFT